MVTKVKIKVCDEPKTFLKANATAKEKSNSEVKFTKSEWTAAKKKGPLEVSYRTGIQNVRLSGGLYQIVEPEPEVVVKPTFVVADKSNEELAAIAAAYGKPIKKQMTRDALVGFIETLVAKSAELIVDDEEPDA